MALPSKPIRLTTGIFCAVVLLSAVVVGAAALFAAAKVNWPLFGFEVATVVACLMGMGVARGRFGDGPALAITCAAGTIFVAAVLGWLGSQRHLSTRTGQVSLDYYLIGRGAAALGLGLIAVGVVLVRNRASWAAVGRSAMWASPLVLAAALLAVGGIRRAVLGGPGWMVGIVLSLGGLGAVVLLSLSMHFLIQAFALGRLDPDTLEPATAKNA